MGGFLPLWAIALIAPFTAASVAELADSAASGADIAQYEAKAIKRWAALEVRQGVAVDGAYFYAITNSRIGKYDKFTGKKLAEWVGDGIKIRHLNSCSVIGAELVCANSNFPQTPMASSVEIFDPASMKHIRSIPLGMGHGSLTWVEKHEGLWYAGFANYDGKGGEPGRDHRFTHIVTFDEGWRVTGGYRLPDSVLALFAPMSNSGGSFGGDGLLYLTGHDAQQIYVLQKPSEGPVMKHIATISAPLGGQAWAWDRSQKRVLYGITRKEGEVVIMTVPEIASKGGDK